MIVLHCRKPRFLSLPVSPPIYRSESVSALYYGPKKNNFQANYTGPYLFFVLTFSKSGRRNNVKSAFQDTVNNNTRQYAKKNKKKKEQRMDL